MAEYLLTVFAVSGVPSFDVLAWGEAALTSPVILLILVGLGILLLWR